jgi:XTP/dITP diphosphohydrolase
VIRPTIVIATTNTGKLREIRQVLSDLPVELKSLHDFPPLAQPLEEADTFTGNAEKKALHYARLTGCWTLADDSGLEVEALGGEPGVRSARYASAAGEPNRGARDAANNAKLIRRLAGLAPDQRSARFVCVVALARKHEILGTAQGVVKGLIVDDPRGDNGFGYDPHFLVPELGLTTAQMPSQQKNRISHRGKAFRAMRQIIERLLLNEG